MFVLYLCFFIIFSAKTVPENALGALDKCYETVFPNIKKIFTIICALPISVALAERSFSTLKRY